MITVTRLDLTDARSLIAAAPARAREIMQVNPPHVAPDAPIG